MASCAACGYAANLEKATSTLPPTEELAASGDGTPELVATPGTKTIDAVAAFLKYSPNNNIKSLAFMLHDGESPAGTEIRRPLLVLMRGNDQMNEAKLVSALRGASFARCATRKSCKYFGSPAGYLGPVGLKLVRSIENKGSAALRVRPGISLS